LASVRARIHADNERSARLLTRAGFPEIDLLPRVEIRPGVFRDCRLFAIDLIDPSRER
jgi:RimJ/RimL family protein N-acetyltransferase